MIRMWSPWDTILGHVCATQRSQIWWVTTKVKIRNYKNIFQNLRLKLSDIEDVVCASASRPEELAGQQVRVFWSFLGLGSQSWSWKLSYSWSGLDLNTGLFGAMELLFFSRDKSRWQWSDLSCDHRWQHLILSSSAQCLLRGNRKSFLCRCDDIEKYKVRPEITPVLNKYVDI